MIRQQQEHSIHSHLLYPTLHPAIVHRNDGLYSIARIPPNTLLAACRSSQVIGIQTLPNCILSTTALDDHQKIVLYVLLLKNSDTQRMSSQLKEWVSRKTMGFIHLSEKLVRECGDEQLLIQYSAYKFHYTQQAKKLYQHPSIKFLLHKYAHSLTLEEFTSQWIEASEFKNTRSFGHTGQYLLIPGLDYLNYDPASSCDKVKFVNYDHYEQIQNIIAQEKGAVRMGALGQDDCQEVDSDFEEETQASTKKYVGIYSAKAIEAGEEILLDYGGLTNYQLLRHYGYAVKNNPHDYVRVYLSNYYRQDPLFFSSVQRCTTKYRLYPDRINYKFLAHWRNISPTQNMEDLVTCMQNHQPPHLPQSKLSHLHSLEGFQVLLLYQQEQSRIYQSNIALLLDHLQVTRQHTPRTSLD